MPDKIKEARRALFEAWFMANRPPHSSKDLWLKLDVRGEYYAQEAYTGWLGFNAALDAVEIELPEPISEHNTNANGFVDLAAKEYDGCLDDCRAAIESTGLGLRIK
jgi:hypothetical protein